MRALLSIKPEFAYNIFNGNKKYEYRRNIFKLPVTHVVVYASSPLRKVIGEFEVGGILYEEIDAIWSQTKEFSGISSQFFYSYFQGKDKGYAIKVQQPRAYSCHLNLKADFGLFPPQSFVYLPNHVTV